MWIQQFDAVLVNVFPMLPCACELVRIKPVLWWIHESETQLYRNTVNRYEEYAKRNDLEKVNIYGVSRGCTKKIQFLFSGRNKGNIALWNTGSERKQLYP